MATIVQRLRALSSSPHAVGSGGGGEGRGLLRSSHKDSFFTMSVTIE